MNDSRVQTAARLNAADKIVKKYLTRHVSMDVGIGLSSFVPAPGAGQLALIAAIGAQAPLVYQPMVKQICSLYERKPDKHIARLVGTANPTDAGFTLVAEFGITFIKEHAKELLQDQLLGFAASWIPFVGGIVAAGLDAIIARKMTIIVAAMAVLHLENGEAWIGSKKKTRAVVATALKSAPYVSFTSFVTALINEHLASEPSWISDSRADHGAEVDAGISGIEISQIVDKIDPHVLNAVERLRGSIRITTLDGFKEGFTTNTGTFMEPGHMNNIKGYVGEEVASDHLHEPLPENIRMEGWDISYQGQHWQIKTGSTAFQRSIEHLEKHPEIPIISDDETVARLHAAGYTDAMSIHDLDNAALGGATHATAISIEELIHMHPDLPIISTLLCTIREIQAFRSGEVGVIRAITNIALQVGSREGAIFTFTFGAVALATACHMLPVAGTFVAGAAITGGLTGKEIGARLRDVRVPAELANRLVSMLRSLDAAHLKRLWQYGEAAV